MTSKGRNMQALLVRVGVDQSRGGGGWNGPVDTESSEFAYVAIPEGRAVHEGMQRPYLALTPVLARFGVALPKDLRDRHMHLDPDFEQLTYGDQGIRARQLSVLQAGDLIVFYAGLRDVRDAGGLVYALVGVLEVSKLALAKETARRDLDSNAHSRRRDVGASDLIVHGRAGVSGRLWKCLPIGEYRDRAYRVRRDLLSEWSGLSVRDGYLQRSARLPRFLNPGAFLAWFGEQRPRLMQANN
jgi:hypothetical protein